MLSRSAFVPLLFLVLLIPALPRGADAQDGFHASVEVTRLDTLARGRDFWFAVPQYLGAPLPGEQHRLLVAARSPGIFHVDCGSFHLLDTLKPYRPEEISLPLNLTLSGSDVIQPAVHVWADTIDLGVQLMSWGPDGGDETIVLPTPALGRSFCVADVRSVARGGAASPGFTVIAAQDDVHIVIVPSCDLRARGGGVLRAGTSFARTLRAGDAVQFLAASDTDDVTGTRIDADKRIGVIATSPLGTIPADSASFGSYLMEEMVPIESWGTTYYTAPTYGVALGDEYLLIASNSGQTIRHYGANTGLMTLPSFGLLQSMRVESSEASRWQSDAPFSLLKFSRSCDTCKYGGTSMSLVPAVSQYDTLTTPSTFEADSSSSAIRYYQIFVPAEARFTFDGKDGFMFQEIFIDGLYSCFLVRNVRSEENLIQTPQPAGVMQFATTAHSELATASALKLPSSRPERPLAAEIDSSAPCLVVRFIDSTYSVARVRFDSPDTTVYATGDIGNTIAKEVATISLCAQDSAYWRGSLTAFDAAGDTARVDVTFDGLGTLERASVGLPEATTQLHFEANPNPASGLISLHFLTPPLAPSHLQVLDARGLLLQNLSVPAGANDVQVDLHAASDGVYFMRLVTGDQATTKRIVIKR